MKPLTATPITRDRKSIGDWVPAAEHLTDHGRAEFAARQKARLETAQCNCADAKDKVRKLK